MARILDVELKVDTKDADKKVNKTTSAFEKLTKVGKATMSGIKEMAKVFAVATVALAATTVAVVKLIDSQAKLTAQRNAFKLYGKDAEDALKGIEAFATSAKLGIGELRGAALELIQQNWHPKAAEDLIKVFASNGVRMGITNAEELNKFILQSVAGLESFGGKKIINESDLKGIGIYGKNLELLQSTLSKVDASKLQKGILPATAAMEALFKMSDVGQVVASAQKDSSRAFQGISNTLSDFQTKFTEAMFGTSEDSASALSRIDLAIKNLSEVLKDPTISASLKAVGDSFSWLAEKGIQLFIDALYSIGPVVRFVKGYFTELWDILEPLTPVFIAIAGAVVALGVAYLVSLVPAMIAATASALSLAAAFLVANAPILLIGAAIGLLIYYWDDLVHEFKHGSGFIGEALRQIYDWGKSVVGIFTGMYDLVKAIFSMDFNKMGSAAMQIAKDFANVQTGGFSNRLLGNTPGAEIEKLSDENPESSGGKSNNTVEQLKKALEGSNVSTGNGNKNGTAASMYSPANTTTNNKTSTQTNNVTFNINGDTGSMLNNSTDFKLAVEDVLDEYFNRNGAQSVG